MPKLRRLLHNIFYLRSVSLLQTHQKLEPRINSRHLVQALFLWKPWNVRHHILPPRVCPVHLSRYVIVKVFNPFRARWLFPLEINTLVYTACMVYPLDPRPSFIIAKSSGLKQKRLIHFINIFLPYLNVFAFSGAPNLFRLRKRLQSLSSWQKLKPRTKNGPCY